MATIQEQKPKPKPQKFNKHVEMGKGDTDRIAMIRRVMHFESDKDTILFCIKEVANSIVKRKKEAAKQA